jgi:hypothetical protein
MLCKFGSIPLVLVFCGLASCPKPKPTQDECKAGITRMMEIQIDALDAPDSPASSAMRTMSDEERKLSTQWLKGQIPSLLKPEFVAQCVDRMKRADLECTMSATTPDELVQKCHWKVVAGPKGGALGF